ncbi:MAG TPA: hypothetical protein VI636_11755 [Candidatus Angelobacter sp.]
MAHLAQFDVGAKQQEARIKALLEDLTQAYIGVRPESRLALAVWWGAKRYGVKEQHLLYLYEGIPLNGISSERVPLYWKTGSQDSPFVLMEATDVDWFSRLLTNDPHRVAQYWSNDDYEVLYFDKTLLNPDLLDKFGIMTEPPGLMKGWYVDEDKYGKSKNVADLLCFYRSFKPYFGFVKTEEKDFEHCRGILHLEISQKWVPFSPEGIQSYSYFNDLQNGRRVFFLFEGGALYEVLRFEVKTAPDYAGRFGLLRTQSDDQYPEVYLRAVRPPAQPSA